MVVGKKLGMVLAREGAEMLHYFVFMGSFSWRYSWNQMQLVGDNAKILADGRPSGHES